MTESDIIRRIDAFRNQKGASKAGMSRELGMDAGTFGNILNGRRGMPMEMLLSFLQAYPDVSAEWLLRGEGTMMKYAVHMQAENGDIITGSNNKNNDGDTLNHLLAMLDEKDKQLSALIKVLETCKQL